MQEIKLTASKKVSAHAHICEKLTRIYQTKNQDYGDSFSILRKEYPEAICIRLGDKLNRLKSLIKSGSKPNHEPIADTLLDIANYAILELMERRCE